MTSISVDGVFEPSNEAAFLERFSARESWVVRNPDRARFADLLSWDDINHLLDQNLLDRRRISVSKDGRSIPPGLYRDPKGERDLIDPVRLRGILDQGASLILNGVQDLFPAVRRLANRLEVLSGHKVNANAYLSFTEGGAFRTHFDPHDVLVLQIHGSKDWELFDQPATLPLREDRSATLNFERNVTERLTLEAGDLIYVPGGVYHRAAVARGFSCHVTFGIHTTKGIDLVSWLEQRLGGEDLFRAPVPVHEGQGAVQAHGERLKARLHDLIDEFDLPQLAADLAARRRSTARFRLGPVVQPKPTDLLVSVVRQWPPVLPAHALAATTGEAGTSRDEMLAILEALGAKGGLTMSALAACTADTVRDVPDAVHGLIGCGLVEIAGTA